MGDSRLFYSGCFITGQIYPPNILFVSITPNYSNREYWDDVARRRAQTKRHTVKPLAIKHRADTERESLPLMGQRECYYARTMVQGVGAHRMRHLCTKLTQELRTELTNKFATLWPIY